MKDSSGRNINYLRISITEQCNLNCKYCNPLGCNKREKERDRLSLTEIIELARIFASLGINKIRLTGGEPLIRGDIIEIVEGISAIDGIDDLSITTNGIFLGEYAIRLKTAGLDRVNISLDTLIRERYSQITGGGNLEAVMWGIEEAERVGLTPIKINTVLIKNFNEDELLAFSRLTMDRAIDVRFIELMPIGKSKEWALNNYLDASVAMQAIAGLKKIDYSDKASPASYYRLEGARGNIGVISAISCKFCENCNRLRLTSLGKLRLCLHSNEEIDLITPLRQGEDIKPIIQAALENKPAEHNLSKGTYSQEDMVAIGG